MDIEPAIDLRQPWEPLMTISEVREAIAIWTDKRATVAGVMMLAALDRPKMTAFLAELAGQPDPLNMVEVAADFAEWTAAVSQIAATVQHRSWLAACDAHGIDPAAV